MNNSILEISKMREDAGSVSLSIMMATMLKCNLVDHSKVTGLSLSKLVEIAVYEYLKNFKKENFKPTTPEKNKTFKDFLICSQCTTTYPKDQMHCPQCGSTVSL